jgi:2'-5' RNA ligase
MIPAQPPDPNKGERLILGALVEPADAKAIASWVRSLSWAQGAQIKDDEDYHVTILHCRTGARDAEQRSWLEGVRGRFELVPVGVEVFTNPGHLSAPPVVLRFAPSELNALADDLHAEAGRRGLGPIRYDGAYRPHVTIGYAEEAPVPPALPGPLVVETIRLWD